MCKNGRNKRSAGAYAGEEGEVGERAVIEQTVFVLRDAVTNLLGRVDCWGRALEAVEVVELRRWHRVAHPVQKLLVRDDPNILLLLCPVQKLVHHFDGRVRRSDTRIISLSHGREVGVRVIERRSADGTYRQMNGVRVQADWLPRRIKLWS